MKRYLFVGPTLPDVSAMIDGEHLLLRPPISAGDLLKLPLGSGDTVAIIDGYFHQARAIPHKEILDVLSRGIRVLGASSMGALRAAELGKFGMEGIGYIAAQYSSGAIDADDEVALLHGEEAEGYTPRSAPLVNIRATLKAARAAGACTQAEADAIIDALRQIPYRRRTYRQLALECSSCGIDSRRLYKISDYCTENQVDQKRDDALELLDVLRMSPRAPSRKAFTVELTVHLHNWRASNSPIAELRAMEFCQIVDPKFPQFYGKLILRWLAAECQSSCGTRHGKPNSSPYDLDRAIEHGFHRGLYDLAGTDFGFLDQWSTAAERAACDRKSLLSLFLVRSFRFKPGLPSIELLLSSLRKEGCWDAVLKLGQRVNAINEMGSRYRLDFTPEDLSSELIMNWLSERWAWPKEELELAAYERGFPSLGKLLIAARHLYLACLSDGVIDAFRMDTL